jgi:DNA repair protein RecO (recombination protein O)
MSQAYKATGINLKSMPLGEADRVLTILTREYGIVRAVAPGARKPKAKLGGRGELFVVNQLLLRPGRSLDKLSQAESLESYPALSRDLAKLTVAQYWAEVILQQATGHEPTVALFDRFCHLLTDLANAPLGAASLVHLAHGILQLLDLGGILPQTNRCCLTSQTIQPDAVPGQIIFSPAAGGVVLPSQQTSPDPLDPSSPFNSRRALTLSSAELVLLQQLIQNPGAELPHCAAAADGKVQEWLNIERALRHYVQYYTERPIRSAALLESCFSLPSTAVASRFP